MEAWWQGLHVGLYHAGEPSWSLPGNPYSYGLMVSAGYLVPEPIVGQVPEVPF